MGFLDRLFTKHQAQTVPDVRSTNLPSQENAFDLVSKAEEAFQAKQIDLAEALFRQANEAYRRTEPDGLDFALGRYGAFLIANSRLDEAARVLEEAIAMGSCIGMVWSDYLRILTKRRDLSGLFTAADQMAASLGSRVGRTNTLLVYASLAGREGDTSFAEAIIRRAMEEATTRADRVARWAAAGMLGRILERTGRVEEAVGLWTKAFEEGSNDPMTVNRLSIHFERAKDYKRATMVIREALARGLPASVEEQLRKRLARCETKLSPGRKRGDVPAFSVRQGERAFELELIRE